MRKGEEDEGQRGRERERDRQGKEVAERKWKRGKRRRKKSSCKGLWVDGET